MAEIVFYCPDRHILYDGRLPAEGGVGGGVTARIRMAQALARQGRAVTMVINCPRRERWQGVDFVPLDQAGGMQCDVLLVNSSGGAYSLNSAELEKMGGALRLYWMSGVDPPAGFDESLFDHVYAKSRFLHRRAVEAWGVPPHKVFVAYNGFEELFFREAEAAGLPRDPFRLVYFSHPSKGLDAAQRVLALLRTGDARFHLHVYGGEALWGRNQQELPPQPGLTFHGLVGQRVLARELVQASYSLCLQDREEPFGMVLTESQRAGCIVLASPAGAFSELIEDRVDGFLVEGAADSPQVVQQAANLVVELAGDLPRRQKISACAAAVPWSSDLMARVWLGHWAYLAAGGSYDGEVQRCAKCGGDALVLPDGLHCAQCGWFVPQVGRCA